MAALENVYALLRRDDIVTVEIGASLLNSVKSSTVFSARCEIVDSLNTNVRVSTKPGQLHGKVKAGPPVQGPFGGEV
jgi:hypothetical protein